MRLITKQAIIQRFKAHSAVYSNEIWLIAADFNLSTDNIASIIRDYINGKFKLAKGKK